MLIVIMTLSLRAESQEIRKLTYEDGLMIALQSSFTFKRQDLAFKSSYYNLKAQSAKLKSRANMTMYLPSFEESIKQEYNYSIDGYQFVSTNQLRFQTQMEIKQPVPTGGYFSLNADFYYRDQKNVEQEEKRDYFGKLFLSFSQPILQPNELKNDIEYAEMGLTETRLKYAESKARSLSWLTGRFYEIYKLQKQIKNNEEMISQYDEACRFAEERRRAGIIDETELLTLQVDQENIKSDLVRLRASRENQEERFKLQIGLDRDINIVVIADEEFVTLNTSLEDAIDLGMQNRVEIIRSQLWLRMNEISFERIKSEGCLTGQIDVTFGYDNSEERFTNIFEEYDKSQSILFTFELPILDWGRNKAKREEKQVEIDKIKNHQVDLSRRIVREITDAFHKVEETIGRLEILRTSQEDAERSYNLSFEQFNNNQLPAQELRLARQRLIDTKDRYLNAYVDYQRALAELNRSTMWNFQRNQSLVTEDEINALIASVDNNDNENNN